MAFTKNDTVVLRGLRGEFFRKRIAMDNPIIDLIAMRVKSNNRSEDYGWLGDVPQLRSWKGGRKITVLTDAVYNLLNEDFEATLAFDRNDFRDDQTGQFAVRVRQLAERAANHPVALMITNIINGTSATLGLGYDGVSIYNNAHPARGDQTAAQDNLLAGTGTTTTALRTDLNAAITALRRVVDETGTEPFSDDFDSLLVFAPPELELNWREVLFAAIISQTTNVMANRADLWISARLTDVNDWYLMNVGSEVKPFIFQEREPLKAESVVDGEGPFMTRKILFGVSARYAAGMGFWQLTNKTVN